VPNVALRALASFPWPEVLPLLREVAEDEDWVVRDAAVRALASSPRPELEFTFELVWKTLQLYLEHEGFESSSLRAVLKRAFVIRLISDQDEADVWLQMLDVRNLTSHAYASDPLSHAPTLPDRTLWRPAQAPP
jgi:nucleotidyltransferase substrate binding protein (TIGR01987 family)